MSDTNLFMSSFEIREGKVLSSDEKAMLHNLYSNEKNQGDTDDIVERLESEIIKLSRTEVERDAIATVFLMRIDDASYIFEKHSHLSEVVDKYENALSTVVELFNTVGLNKSDKALDAVELIHAAITSRFASEAMFKDRTSESEIDILTRAGIAKNRIKNIIRRDMKKFIIAYPPIKQRRMAL